MEVQFKGLDAMVAKLQKAQKDVSGPGVRKAISKGAVVVRDRMRERAPVLDKKTPGSNALEPGALRSGIRSYLVKDSNPPEALAGPGKSTAYVARFVEYGHRQVAGGALTIHGKGKGRVVGEDVQADPFLRPAFEESVEACGKAIADSLSATFKESVS